MSNCIGKPVGALCMAAVGKIACMETAVSFMSVWPECDIKCM